eukprot:10059891-Lingulodinium_polyedra.AAC.1
MQAVASGRGSAGRPPRQFTWGPNTGGCGMFGANWDGSNAQRDGTDGASANVAESIGIAPTTTATPASATAA